MLSYLSHVQLSVTLWTVALQAPLSVGFSRQEYGAGCHILFQYLPNAGIKPTSLMSPALAGRFFTTSTTWEEKKPWIRVNRIHICSKKKQPLCKLFTFVFSLTLDHTFKGCDSIIVLTFSSLSKKRSYWAGLRILRLYL